MKTLIASESLFSIVDTAYLDCVTDNLALLLLHRGIRDVRTPFACHWHFAFHEGQNGGLPELSRSPLTEALETQTGWNVQQDVLNVADCIETLSQHLRQNQPVLVFGDAYFIPWQPYFGHDHQEHSFLIDGISEDNKFVHIVDAHENTTEWGQAQPVACDLPAMALKIILNQQSEHAQTYWWLEQCEGRLEIDLTSLLLANAQHMLAPTTRGQFEAFVRYYHEHIQDMEIARTFELALWLIGRARMLHSLWLQDIEREHPALLPLHYADRFANEVVVFWQRAREQSYLMLRRVMRGRPAPEACFSLLGQTIVPQEIMLADALFQHLQKVC
ncbi:MAG TPA: hypothetical protein VH593_17160 [Ktedonobacteraceae bacterium]